MIGGRNVNKETKSWEIEREYRVTDEGGTKRKDSSKPKESNVLSFSVKFSIFF